MKKVRLGDLVTIDSGFAFKSSLFNESEGMPIIRIRDVNSGQTNTFYSGEYDEKYIVNKGDLLIGMDGNFTIRKWDSGKALLNQRVCRIKSNSNELSNEYLYRIMPNHLKMIEDRTPFVTVKHLSVKSIDNIELYLPSLEIQKKIANTLDKAQRLIDKRKEQIELLDELVKSRFIEMFGDPIVNSRGWEIRYWNEILTIKNGKNQKAIEDKNGIYKICGSGGFMSYGNDYICNENTVIIGRKGNINKPILMREKFWNVDTAFGLEPNNKWLNVDYLYIFCEMYNFEKHNKAVTIPSLTKGDLLNIEMSLPPIELQNKFADFVKQVDKLKFEMKKSLEELEDNLNSLMKKAFNGELFQ